MSTPRRILLVTHTGRHGAAESAARLVDRLHVAGIEVVAPTDEAEELALPSLGVWQPGQPVELVLVLGGDGTILRGAELARTGGAPLLGINLGRVGFLAEAEEQDLDQVAAHVVDRGYVVEPRATVEVEIEVDGEVVERHWALNEIAVEKAAPARMIEVGIEVDGLRLSRWGCDGVVCATPTGSTAYAFSAGGPVVWPEVDALLVVPLSAHALFARPLVVAPTSVIRVDLLPMSAPAVLSADGRRGTDLPPGGRVTVRSSDAPVLLARLHPTPFTERLVAKFALPVQGWTVDRGRVGDGEAGAGGAVGGDLP